MMLKYYLPLLLLALCLPVQATQYQAPVTDTRWRVIESPLECWLSQEIPDFGKAEFSQHSGSEMTLTFTTTTQPAVQTNVAFEIAGAPWQNWAENKYLISIPTTSGQRKFSIDGPVAQQALTAMTNGEVPAVRYRSQNSSEDITALLSTIHLSDALTKFNDCIANLHPDSYEDIRNLTVYFEIEKADLTPKTRDALARLAKYVKLDNAIKRIHIDSHTDNHGRRRLNAELSDNRAIAIKAFLLKQGISESLITLGSHMEHRPAATNKTISGRALNRRAEIEVFR